ncbi:hypothetical protein L345_15260, partial [Ophiophagus hannah]
MALRLIHLMKGVRDPATKSLEMTDTVSLVGTYYSGKSVLVTGATGFMGKVLVEKLLRSCHGVKAIYVCVRPKGGRSMQTRVENLLKCKVFDRVREDWPNFHKKIKPICAEFTQPNLAISSKDMEELVSEVNVIFHCAATVRFDEPLKRSVRTQQRKSTHAYREGVLPTGPHNGRSNDGNI